MFPLGKSKVSVEVSPSKPKTVKGVLPPKPEEQAEVFSENEGILSEMVAAGTASTVDVESAFAKDMVLNYYAGGTPTGFNLGSNVTCHGAGVQATTYRVYHMERRPARSPENFNNRYGHYPRLYMTDRGRTTRVGTMRGEKNHGLGRAGGATGWDETRDMFGFSLASFRHNFEALIGAFSSRPSLPCTEHWTLPNLVYSKEIRRRERRYNSTIVEPAVAVPPASYSYSFVAPTPMMVLAVGTKCPEETEAMIEYWGADKRNLVEPFEATFPEGDSETVFSFRATPPGMLREGYFNVNPTSGPMTVGYVDVYFPPV